MRKYLMLAGGAEFGGAMAQADRHAIALAGGNEARIRIIPTAAAPDQNHLRAGRNGVNWFRSLGSRDVAAVALIDRTSANDSTLVADLRSANLIYLLGGFTHYLGCTLAGSRALEAIQAAQQGGAVVAGSSAGAMVLCSHYYDPIGDQVHPGLGFVTGCVLPHHTALGTRWAPRLATLIPTITLIGIDEQTALLNDGPPATPWQVYGSGTVTLYPEGRGDFLIARGGPAA